MTDGTVTAIHVAPSEGADPQAVQRARAVAGRGLEGDRYFADEGTFADREGADLTLIESETLTAIEREAGIDLLPGAHRRNLTTSGVALDNLVGDRFRVGDAVCKGTVPCAPCSYLEDHVGVDGLREALADRGGLRATILETGEIWTDCGISPLE